jgi:cytidine deaminase
MYFSIFPGLSLSPTAVSSQRDFGKNYGYTAQTEVNIYPIHLCSESSAIGKYLAATNYQLFFKIGY